MTNAADFAALHHTQRPFLLPNAWDVASALLLADAGFAAIGTTSLGVTASAGLLDGAGAGRDLTLALARELVSRLPVPLTVDLEGGYSEEPAVVADLAAELADLGVAGINLEDGRPDGGLRAGHTHAAIIGAVVTAAPGLFINARTDVFLRGLVSADRALAETVDRGRRYRETGADGLFVPGVSDEDTIRGIVDGIGAPLNVMVVPNLPSVAELAALGVSRVSAGAAMIKATYELVRQMTRQLLADGVYDDMFGASVDYGETNALFARS